MNTVQTAMNFATYEKSGQVRYARLAEAVTVILTAALRLQPTLRLQHLQRRAKDSASLRKKLERAHALESEDIGTIAKDLAGCRLVFYTNSDVARFQSSGMVTDNFVVDWARTKIHHPNPQTTAAADLFISDNYVLRFKDERLAMAEYAEFRGLWCELQVQTTLNHAWSEMAHDTIYKTPALEGFGGALMQDIEKRMKKIMREHLLPAGYEFQKVADDFERLQNGKQLFDQGALRQLESCEDNNARYELLKRFDEYVLPSYDDLGKVHTEVRAAVVTALLLAYGTETRAIETPFGDLSGNSVESVVNVGVGILEHLRYFDVEGTFDSVCTLFRSAPTDQVRKRLLSVAEKLSKPELEVWKQTGPVVQQRLVERIQRLGRVERDSIKPVILRTLEQVLKTELTGTSTTYNAVTFHRAAAVPSDDLADIRAGAITLLKEFFRQAESEQERRTIVQTLAAATQAPYRGTSDPLVKTLLRSATDIVEFYVEVAPRQSYEMLEHLEHTLLWQYRRKGKPRPDEDPGLAPLRAQLVDRIVAFRDAVNADRKFVIYKTLVGFESVFPPEWEGNGLEASDRDAYRNERIGQLVAEVTQGTAQEWYAMLVRCASTESIDGATFISFGHFLEALGKAKPRILMSYLDRLDFRLAKFLPSMLGGLELTLEKDALHDTLRQWIASCRYIGQIIWYQRFAATIDLGLLDSALTAAIQTRDDPAVLRAVTVAVARHADVEGGLKTVFLTASTYLAENGDTSWVGAAAAAGKNTIFSALAENEVDFMLKSLIRCPQVNYRVEEILKKIADTWPMKVVDYFGGRLRAELTHADGVRYEPVPFEFQLLPPLWAKNPQSVVAAVRGWFTDDREQFSYRGGRFLANVFPAFTPEYEQVLLTLCAGGATTDLEFLIQLLGSYSGQTFTHILSKDIIEALPANDPLLRHICTALALTGTLMGEFGRVQAYREKKQALELWLADPRERVREFAKGEIHDLEMQIAGEQRRSEEALEFRKRSYESPGDDAQNA